MNSILGPSTTRVALLVLICVGRFAVADEPARPADRSPAPPSASATSRIGAIPAEIEVVYRGTSPASIEQLREMEAHQKDVVAKVMPCIVGLQIGQAQGSGVIINAEGLILTAAHVVQRPNQSVSIILPDGKRVAGRTLGLDRSSDAGMVKINAPPPPAERVNGDPPESATETPSSTPSESSPDPALNSNQPAPDSTASEESQAGWPYLELGESDKLAVGQWTLTMGHPGGYQPGRKPVVRIGRILSIDKDLVVSDGTLVGGDSGGPLIDMSGKVIGIHSRIGGSLTANMHVPIQAFRDSWDRLVASEMWGDVPRGSPYIGVQGDPENEHAKIVFVEPGQPADKAGIQLGDIVTQFEDKPITNFSSLASAVSDCEPGQKVTVHVRRGEETMKLELEIGRRR